MEAIHPLRSITQSHRSPQRRRSFHHSDNTYGDATGGGTHEHILWKRGKWLQWWLWYVQLLNTGGQWILVGTNKRRNLWDVCWEIRGLPSQSPPSCPVVTAQRGVVSSSVPVYHLSSCYSPLRAWLPKARTLRPLIVQDQVTSWVTSDPSVHSGSWPQSAAVVRVGIPPL